MKPATRSTKAGHPSEHPGWVTKKAAANISTAPAKMTVPTTDHAKPNFRDVSRRTQFGTMTSTTAKKDATPGSGFLFL